MFVLQELLCTFRFPSTAQGKVACKVSIRMCFNGMREFAGVLSIRFVQLYLPAVWLRCQTWALLESCVLICSRGCWEREMRKYPETRSSLRLKCSNPHKYERSGIWLISRLKAFLLRCQDSKSEGRFLLLVVFGAFAATPGTFRSIRQQTCQNNTN